MLLVRKRDQLSGQRRFDAQSTWAHMPKLEQAALDDMSNRAAQSPTLNSWKDGTREDGTNQVKAEVQNSSLCQIRNCWCSGMTFLALTLLQRLN